MSPLNGNARPAVIFGLMHAGLALTRSLGRAGVPVSGITLDGEEFGLRSRYLRRRFLVSERGRERQDEQVLAAVRAVAKEGRVVFFPQYEAHVDFVLRRWHELRELADVPLPDDPGIVQRLRRKELLPALAAEAGVPAPRAVLADDEQPVRGAGLQAPLVVKPAESNFALVFGTKAVAAKTVDEALAVARKAREHHYRTIVQELVPDSHDRVFSLLTYIGRDGEPLASVVGRKVRQGPPHFGTGTVFETSYDPRVLELGLKLLRHAGYRGFAEVEFAHDPRDDEFKLIEVNSRVPVWCGLAMSRYFDVARVAYDDLCGRPSKAGRVFTDKAAWIYLAKDLAVSLQLARRGELRVPQLLAPYLEAKKVRSLFAADDPWPAAASLNYLRSRVAVRLRGH